LAIPLAGFWSSRPGPTGTATVSALPTGLLWGDVPARVALYWAGPVASPLAQPVYVKDLSPDGTGLWWADFAVPPGEAGRQIYRLVPYDAAGNAGGSWPALSVAAGQRGGS